MNARSVTSFQVIRNCSSPESSWRNLVPYPPLRQRRAQRDGPEPVCHPPLSSDRFGNGSVNAACASSAVASGRRQGMPVGYGKAPDASTAIRIGRCSSITPRLVTPGSPLRNRRYTRPSPLKTAGSSPHDFGTDAKARRTPLTQLLQFSNLPRVALLHHQRWDRSRPFRRSVQLFRRMGMGLAKRAQMWRFLAGGDGFGAERSTIHLLQATQSPGLRASKKPQPARSRRHRFGSMALSRNSAKLTLVSVTRNICPGHWISAATTSLRRRASSLAILCDRHIFGHRRVNTPSTPTGRTRAVKPGGQIKYLLSGVLVCSCCRSKMVVTGTKPRRYACSSFHHGGRGMRQLGLSVSVKLAARACYWLPSKTELSAKLPSKHAVSVLQNGGGRSQAPGAWVDNPGRAHQCRANCQASKRFGGTAWSA